MTSELRFRAMGSDCHLIVVGGAANLITQARDRIEQLERRWSRFLPDSEVSTLNRRPGIPMVVSADTLVLVERALQAKEMTNSLFEPTVLGDLMRAGYDRSFDQLGEQSEPAFTDLGQGPIAVIGPTVVLAPGTGLDPGGIGKGLAADMVSREMIMSGADGVCVNLGGDVRVSGRSPGTGPWTVSIDHPELQYPLALVQLTDGAVATSTTLLRRWSTAEGRSHHLIDPRSGQPSRSDLVLVSVIAAEGWLAEAHAKAALLAGSGHCFDLVSTTGIEAMAVTAQGDVISTPGFDRFALGEPAARLEEATL
ncbi:MAG: FAD:protein FMN transferase [Acidimicrobiia bacterium]